MFINIGSIALFLNTLFYSFCRMSFHSFEFLRLYKIFHFDVQFVLIYFCYLSFLILQIVLSQTFALYNFKYYFTEVLMISVLKFNVGPYLVYGKKNHNSSYYRYEHPDFHRLQNILLLKNIQF